MWKSGQMKTFGQQQPGEPFAGELDGQTVDTYEVLFAPKCWKGRPRQRTIVSRIFIPTHQAAL